MQKIKTNCYKYKKYRNHIPYIFYIFYASTMSVNRLTSYMFFNKNDAPKLFAGKNISQHHSIGALLSIGFHFGKN